MPAHRSHHRLPCLLPVYSPGMPGQSSASAQASHGQTPHISLPPCAAPESLQAAHSRQ